MKKSIKIFAERDSDCKYVILNRMWRRWKSAKKNPYEGKWIAVVAEALGTQMPIEECFEGDVNLEIEHSGKVKFTIDDDKGTGKLVKKVKKPILKIEGKEMISYP